jgi:RHS repeat-associated protein
LTRQNWKWVITLGSSITARGKTRQINDYGSDCAKAPSIAYGLAIAGIHSDENEYLNKYTAKELQSGDFDPSLGTGLEMFDFHARFYDPQLGRWFTPDPAEQFSNPYLAMGNNPVVYVDPDGEFAHLIIGAVIGGVQGFMMGQQLGLSGWDLFATTIAGAGLGTLTAGVGASVGASAGTVAGAIAGGAVAGAGNGVIGGLATNQNFSQIANAAFVGGFKGALTGLVGGSVGASIGGGAGAFFGGASGGAFGTLINGGTGDDIWKGAALGGILSYGLYHANGALSYRKYMRGNVSSSDQNPFWSQPERVSPGFGIEGNKLSYRQYLGIQADFQRSRFWKREHGGHLLSNGRIDRSAVIGRGRDFILWDPNKVNQDAWADYHIHHGEAGSPAPNGGVWMADHSPLDLNYRADREFIGSIVANRIDTYYRPPGVFNRSGLINFNTNFNNPLTFPFFGW